MRILHLDEQRGWRGGEQQASYLVRGLAQRGHEVHIAGRSGGEFITRDHGAELAGVHAFPFAGEADLYTAYALARLVRREGIHILHAHTSHTHTLACLARRVAKCGRVVVSRRVDFAPSRGLWSRMKYRWPDRYIAISNAIADVLYAAGVPPDAVKVVHSAIDPHRFDVPPLDTRSLGLPEDAAVLGNVAALVGHKDQATLLHAMARVAPAWPQAHLVIAGDGPLRAALEALRDRLALGGRVHFLGYRDDIPRLLRTLDIFVMSSKEEGLGTSVLDAMACGVPVVATAGGGIPEMVRHDTTGWLAPVGDAEALARGIVTLGRDPALCKRLATAAAAMVHEEFHVDRMVAGNEAVYDELWPTAG